MKNVKSAIAGLLTVMSLVFLMSGCVEHRYYHQHHYHTRGYYERHHTQPPPGVDINIHN